MYEKKMGRSKTALRSRCCLRRYYPKETMEEASPYINYYNKPCSISSTCGMPVTRLVCICAEARINKRMILLSSGNTSSRNSDARIYILRKYACTQGTKDPVESM